MLPLGDGWVVAEPERDRLLVLNSTARLIWDLWQQGQDADTIAETLVARYDIDQAQAEADVRQAIADWQRPAVPSAALQDDHWPTQAQLDIQPDTNSASLVDHYRIHTTPIRVICSVPVIRDAIHPLLAHMATSALQPATTTYHVDATADGYRLRQGLRVIYQGPSLDLAAVMLQHEAQLAAYRDNDNLCVLHAGGVARGDQCILMPGIAGAGKSTLTAALLHSGLDYLSDDTVPISAASGYAIPLTPPLCIKAGSIGALRGHYPLLASQRVYQRTDQRVRYLAPPAASLAGRHERQVLALIFPQYQPGSEARLNEIPPTQAFAWLVEAGIFAHRPRDPARLAALVNWFDGLRSYRLQYDDLDDACRRVHEAFNTRMRSSVPL